MTRTTEEYQEQIIEELDGHLQTVTKTLKTIGGITRPTYKGFEDSITLQRLRQDAAGLQGSLQFTLGILQDAKRFEEHERSQLLQDTP